MREGLRPNDNLRRLQSRRDRDRRKWLAGHHAPPSGAGRAGGLDLGDDEGEAGS